jgi:hypothetical protein
MVFVKPLRANARPLLSQAVLPPPFQIGGSTLVLTAVQMRSLPIFFREIPDPRRAQGRRHGLSTVLAIAAGAVLCGLHGYRAIADWAQDLGPKARERFGCRREKGRYVVPSESIIRNVLIRVPPAHRTAPGSAGTKFTRAAMRVWLSTVKPCATPSMRKVVRLTS